MFDKWQSKINKKLREKDDEVIVFKNTFDEAPIDREAEDTEPSGGGLNISASERDGEGAIKFKLVRPESFEEVSKIADHLIDGCTVVLNTENIDNDTCMRMLDFLNGVTYTTDGYINAVAKNTYIITPSDVDVSGED